MRIIFPKEIDELSDLISPYMIYDKDKGEMVLMDDAPVEIVEAKRKYHKWLEENANVE